MVTSFLKGKKKKNPSVTWIKKKVSEGGNAEQLTSFVEDKLRLFHWWPLQAYLSSQ